MGRSALPFPTTFHFTTIGSTAKHAALPGLSTDTPMVPEWGAKGVDIVTVGCLNYRRMAQPDIVSPQCIEAPPGGTPGPQLEPRRGGLQVSDEQ